MSRIDCSLKRNRNKQVCKTRKKSIGEAEFSVILPKRDNSGQKINNRLYQKYISKMNKRFGGSTINPNLMGCFKNKDTKRIECETNLKVSSIRDFENPFDDKSHLTDPQKKRLLDEDFKFLKKLSKEAGDEFGQTAMLTIRNNIDDASLILTKRKVKLRPNKIFDDFFNKNL